jgi:hypothetical protein
VIYGHIEPWMARENPEFAEAVSRYYSLEHGRSENAAVGELAWWQMAEELLDRRPRLLGGAAYYGPLNSRAAAIRAADKAARQHKDDTYFRRMAAAVQTARTNEDSSGRPVEFLWEAYYFLRKRDGENSPLPCKCDVKQLGALVWAFTDPKLLPKLGEYLWQSRGLTEAEIRRVLRQQSWHLRSENERNWKRYIEDAGLKSLPQKQAGGRRRRH